MTSWTEAGWPDLEGVAAKPKPLGPSLRKVLAAMRGEPVPLDAYDDLPEIIAIAQDLARDPWVPRDARIGLASIMGLATGLLLTLDLKPPPSSPPTD